VTDLEQAIYFLNNANGCVFRAFQAGIEVDGHLLRSMKTMEYLRETLESVNACQKPSELSPEELESAVNG
jgi:hypothetical protein